MDTRTSLFSGILLSSALLATGCGGGGDDAPQTIAIDSTTPIAITQDNAVTIASTVLAGGMEASYLAGMNMYAKPGATQAGRDASYQQAYDLALNNVIKALGSRNSTSTASLPAGVVIKETAIPCDSGSFYISWNDADGDPATVNNGDSASLVYNNCTYSSANGSSTQNGSFTFTLNSITGDPSVVGSDWSMSLSFSANLTGSSAYQGYSGNFTMSGGATLASSSVAGVISGTMSGTSLKSSATWTDASGSFSGSVELADFNFANVMDTNISTYITDIDYTLRSHEIHGSVMVVTEPVFAGTFDPVTLLSNPPTSGTMVITGAAGSSLTLTAYNGYVTISVNGGAAKQYTWAELGVYNGL